MPGRPGGTGRQVSARAMGRRSWGTVAGGGLALAGGDGPGGGLRARGRGPGSGSGERADRAPGRDMVHLGAQRWQPAALAGAPRPGRDERRAGPPGGHDGWPGSGGAGAGHVLERRGAGIPLDAAGGQAHPAPGRRRKPGLQAAWPSSAWPSTTPPWPPGTASTPTTGPGRARPGRPGHRASRPGQPFVPGGAGRRRRGGRRRAGLRVPRGRGRVPGPGRRGRRIPRPGRRRLSERRSGRPGARAAGRRPGGGVGQAGWLGRRLAGERPHRAGALVGHQSRRAPGRDVEDVGPCRPPTSCAPPPGRPHDSPELPGGAGPGAGLPPHQSDQPHRKLLGVLRRAGRLRVLGQPARSQALRGGTGRNPPRAGRAYALLTTAIHDAAVACWDAKYHYWDARPAMLEPRITPLFTTPNHPSYPSAHGSLGSAAGGVLAALFPSDAATFEALVAEISEARIAGGIHVRSDQTAGEGDRAGRRRPDHGAQRPRGVSREPGAGAVSGSRPAPWG